MWGNQTINYRSSSDQKVVKFLGRLYIYTHTFMNIHIFVAAVYSPSHVQLFVTGGL